MLEIHLKNSEVIYVKNFSNVKFLLDTLITIEKENIHNLTLYDDSTYIFYGATTVILRGEEISYLSIG